MKAKYATLAGTLEWRYIGIQIKVTAETLPPYDDGLCEVVEEAAEVPAEEEPAEEAEEEEAAEETTAEGEEGEVTEEETPAEEEVEKPVEEAPVAEEEVDEVKTLEIPGFATTVVYGTFGVVTTGLIFAAVGATIAGTAYTIFHLIPRF